MKIKNVHNISGSSIGTIHKSFIRYKFIGVDLGRDNIRQGIMFWFVRLNDVPTLYTVIDDNGLIKEIPESLVVSHARVRDSLYDDLGAICEVQPDGQLKINIQNGLSSYTLIKADTDRRLLDINEVWRYKFVNNPLEITTDKNGIVPVRTIINIDGVEYDSVLLPFLKKVLYFDKKDKDVKVLDIYNTIVNKDIPNKISTIFVDVKQESYTIVSDNKSDKDYDITDIEYTDNTLQCTVHSREYFTINL